MQDFRLIIQAKDTSTLAAIAAALAMEFNVLYQSPVRAAKGQLLLEIAITGKLCARHIASPVKPPCKKKRN